MSAGFTPGPWKIGIWNGDPNRKHVVDMLGGRKTTFAMLTDRSSMFPPSAIVHSDGDRCEIEANAHLIAAAPALYARLTNALHQLQHLQAFPENVCDASTTSLIELIEADLAQARGDIVDPLEQVKL